MISSNQIEKQIIKTSHGNMEICNGTTLFDHLNKNIEHEVKGNNLNLNITFNSPSFHKKQLFTYSNLVSEIYATAILKINSSRWLNKTIYSTERNPNRFWLNLIICVLCTLMILATLVGNALVILAVLIVKKLHTKDNANNYLIVSLAISDLLVGILVLPFALNVEMKHENK